VRFLGNKRSGIKYKGIDGEAFIFYSRTKIINYQQYTFQSFSKASTVKLTLQLPLADCFLRIRVPSNKLKKTMQLFYRQIAKT